MTRRPPLPTALALSATLAASLAASPVAAIQAHRDEVASFTAEVSSAVGDVVFCSLSYAELLRHWVGQPALADHAAALAARFDLGQS